MKTITVNDPHFFKTFTQLCELIPRLRFIASRVFKIEQSPLGIRFLDANGEQIAALRSETIKQAQEDFNATFRD